MPTYEVEINSRLLDGKRSLRVPAPDVRLAKRRGARRALALAQPGLAEAVGPEEFTLLAGQVAASTKARKVAA